MPLGIAGKVALAGIAVGGAIALHAAVRLPQRISAAVVTSPAIGIAAERRATVLAHVDRMEAEGMRSAVEDSMTNGYPPELRRDPARFAAFRARWLGNDPASYAAIYRMLAAMDLRAEIASIACPVLVLGGSLDRVRPPALAEPVAKLIPGARYQVIEFGPLHGRADPGAARQHHHRLPGRCRRLSSFVIPASSEAPQSGIAAAGSVLRWIPPCVRLAVMTTGSSLARRQGGWQPDREAAATTETWETA